MGEARASVVVPVPLDAVWAWHERPGATDRLLAPWLPVHVLRESRSLRDGAVTFGMTGGIRWTTRHDSNGFVPGRQFVDELVTPGVGELVDWRHTHLFEDLGSERTRITDVVESRLPARFIEPALAYRGRQLLGDLTSHERAFESRQAPMTIAVTGSSGLVGSALCAFLESGGHRVVRLVRGRASNAAERRWEPSDPDEHLLDGIDAVVHLAGTPIAGRFTDAHKQAVRDSRVIPTRRLAALVGERPFVVASAVGIYGPDRGNDGLTEDSVRGDGFLADVVTEWEAATEPARASGARVVNVRTGIVQSPRGGVLGRLRPLFMLGLGGRLGDGRQWTSWIGIDDLVDIYLRALIDARLEGPVNAVAPEPVTNDEYTRTLGHVLQRPTVLTVPSVAATALYGAEGAREFVLAGQRVQPARLEELGHPFRHRQLEPALRHLLGRV